MLMAALVAHGGFAQTAPVMVDGKVEQRTLPMTSPFTPGAAYFDRKLREDIPQPSAYAIHGGRRPTIATGVNEEYDRRYDGIIGDGSEVTGAGVGTSSDPALDMAIKNQNDPNLIPEDHSIGYIMTRTYAPEPPDPAPEVEPPVEPPPIVGVPPVEPPVPVEPPPVVGAPPAEPPIPEEPPPVVGAPPAEPPIVVFPPVVGEPPAEPPVPVVTTPVVAEPPTQPPPPIVIPPVVVVPPPPTASSGS